MTFDLIAKSLLKNSPSAPVEEGSGTKRNAVLAELSAAGFSRSELFDEYRLLYDSSEDEGTKRQILDAMSKIHGLFKEDQVKAEVPQVIINIVGDNSNRVNSMLCPPLPHPATDPIEVER